MSSKEKWESYNHGVDDLTTTGKEVESWAKRSTRKDLHESFLQAREKDRSVHNDIAGFSSSDEDDETNAVGFMSARKLHHSSAAKRTLTAHAIISKSKRQKHNQEYSTPLSYFPQRTFGTPTNTVITSGKAQDATSSTFPVTNTFYRLGNTNPYSTLANTSYKKNTTPSSNCPGTGTPCTKFSRASIYPCQTPHPTLPTRSASSCRNSRKWKLFSNSFESSFTTETPRTSTSAKEDINIDINWSDSDNEDINTTSTDIDNSHATSDKIPFSAQSINQEQGQAIGNIDEFESDSELSVQHLDIKESSPHISPNTPSLSPTPCTPTKDSEQKPPVNSSKKGKKKYLRGGLAERLHKLTQLENCNRSFWLHKTQTNDRENENESSEEGTVTLRVLSERLDHSVYILTCQVLSQDGEQLLPKHVTVLLENQRRKNLEMGGTSSFLKIFSPWKILHLPGMSEPLLMSMAHCEVIPSSSLDFISEDVGQSCDENQVQIVEVTHQEETGETPSVEWKSRVKNSYDDEIIRTAVNWSLLDFTGYEGVFIARVNVTGRVQRIYWRLMENKDYKLNSGSSMTASIIHNAKILSMEKCMSLCCLVQGLTNVCCEVILWKDLLLNRTDWRDVLCQSEGSMLSFFKLRLLERRNRKRAHQLFSLIDSLKRTGSKQQQSCFVFALDGQSTRVQHVSEEQGLDYPKYCPSEDVNDLDSSTVTIGQRVSICGRLLHVKFTSDKYYNTKHVRLWLSVKSVPLKCSVASEPSVIQVRYFSGRPVAWNASTLLSGQLVNMKDLVLEKENPIIMKADIFSKIQVIISESSKPHYDKSSQNIHQIWQSTMTKRMTDEDFTCLQSFPVVNLQNLSENCLIDTLVTFEGTITGVDHDNAFCWYTCPSCNTEEVIEISPSLQYRCCACSLRFNSPVTNVHLEVYLQSADMPTLRIKVKLLQDTTKRLLSGSEKTDKQTYDVNSVLNKQLGPMPCLIVERIQNADSKISFILEEINNCYSSNDFIIT